MVKKPTIEKEYLKMLDNFINGQRDNSQGDTQRISKEYNGYVFHFSINNSHMFGGIYKQFTLENYFEISLSKSKKIGLTLEGHYEFTVNKIDGIRILYDMKAL